VCGELLILGKSVIRHTQVPLLQIVAVKLLDSGLGSIWGNAAEISPAHSSNAAIVIGLVDYYHRSRTHLSLDKDCPDARPFNRQTAAR